MSTTAFPANPFTSPFHAFLPSDTLVEEESSAADARDEYALVASGPAVAADEVETDQQTVEVKVRWGTQVLALRHLAAGRGFTLGEGGDFVVPELLRTTLVTARGASTWACVPAGATATVSRNGAPGTLAAEGEEIELGAGIAVTIELGALTIDLATVRAGKKTRAGLLAALASGAAACIGLSFVGHAAIVASLAMFLPRLGADDAEEIRRDQTLTMKALLDASAEREDEQQKEMLAAGANGGSGQQGGEAHKGESGVAGTTNVVPTHGHMSLGGSDDRNRLSRAEELRAAQETGLVGMLRNAAALTGPSSPWAEDTMMGMDPASHWGALVGATIDDATGTGGLGLWGTGQGGGGHGAGVGIDGIGDLVGNGRCTGPGPCPSWGGRGDKQGIGIGHGPGGGGHVAKAPIARPDPNVEVNGRLPAEVIQRIVRQNVGRFRLCYESGLRTNPGLTGRVVTKFVIGRDGSVAQASDSGSSLADQGVVACIVRTFTALSFPEPQGGVATVIYPISLSPGE